LKKEGKGLCADGGDDVYRKRKKVARFNEEHRVK